ncbi:MAG: acetoacetate--CoA ligase [Gemmatimonadota bacterium]|nr:acetoacetate--CoA ligase [Gemmatimonadota bacterium]
MTARSDAIDARPPLWTPPRNRARATNLAKFAAWAAEHGEGSGPAVRTSPVVARPGDPAPSTHPTPGHPNRPHPHYPALWRWSITEQSAFWAALWEWCGVVGERGGRVLVDGDRMPGARYFPDARLNFAENLLRRRTDDPAIIAWSEAGARRVVTWRELHDLTSRLAQAMRDAGIGPGDRVAALLPNVPEAIVILLAAASIGAVLSTASPDFGVRGVIDRFGQVRPRLLFVTDGYSYRGKRYETLERVPEILAGLPTVERTVGVPNPGGPGDPALSVADRTVLTPPPARDRRTAASTPASQPPAAPTVSPIPLNDFIAPYDAAEIPFARLPFDHPLYILFSSGTTGVPKCIVHRAGGVLLQHLKEHQLHCDIRPGDRVFYYTTLGWMMWNWLVSALASEATILLYDGSPVHPGNDALFDFAEAGGMTLLGTSPGYLEALRKSGFRPGESHDLSSLRTVISTGSPLSVEGFEYVYEHVKPDVHLASVSGGTDLCACFVGGIPTRPVRAGEIQGPVLGMAVDVFADDGTSLATGKGELVCTRPFPSLPLGFVGDDDGSRCRATYFDRFPGVWHHGDYAEKTAAGGYIIHGRSDATLNVQGVRIGTAEVYRPVEAMDEVAEALSIAQLMGATERMVLFVRLASEVRLDEELEGRIRAVLRTQASPRHVPAKVVQVPDIPRTRSGKIVELAVRAVVHGEPVRNVEALANPEALEWFRGVGEL